MPTSSRVADPAIPARETLRDRHKRETRATLLEQAYALFDELGFERATMRALAQRSGVALGTIFKHFPDKHALLGAAFREVIGRHIEEAFASLPVAGLTDRLLHLTRYFYRFYAARPSLARVLVKEIPLLPGPESAAVGAQATEFLRRVGALYVEAMQRGELRPDVDLVAAVGAFWSFYLMSLTAGLMGPHFDVDAQVDLVQRLLRQHLRGIGAAPTAEVRR